MTIFSKTGDIVASGKTPQTEQKKHSEAVLGNRAPHGLGGQMIVERVNAFMRETCATSTREVDALVGSLATLREKLHTDCHRIERDLATYAALCQSVMQLIKIAADGMVHVNKPSIDRPCE